MKNPVSRSAIITGASDGIGKALALALARRSWSVGLLARREELLRQVCEEARQAGAPVALWRGADVCDSEACTRALDELDQELGGATLYIANAGVDASDWRRTIEVNLVAAIEGIEHMIPKFRSRRGARIVGVTSVAAARGLPSARAYSSSKAGFHAYLEGLELDLRKSGIEVSIVAPGFIRTPMTKDATFPMPFLMDSQLAAERFVRGIEKGRTLIIAPRPWIPIFWILRGLPHWLYRRIAAVAPRNRRS